MSEMSDAFPAEPGWDSKDLSIHSLSAKSKQK
jgi:hypothetical protein